MVAGAVVAKRRRGNAGQVSSLGVCMVLLMACTGTIGESGVSTPPAENVTMPPGAAPLDPAPGPSRVVRLDRESYTQSLAAFLEGPAASAEAPPAAPRDAPSVFGWVNPSDRFSTRARSYGVDTNDFAALERASQRFAAEYAASFPDCDDGCQRGVIAEAGQRLLRRPLRDGELDEFMAVPLDGATDVERLTLRLRALLLSPSFVFRIEIGDEGEANSDQALSAAELASALAFTLTRQPPDQALARVRDDGSLVDDGVLAAHATRLLDTPAHRRRVHAFVRQFWRYPDAKEVAKDERPRDVFPESTPGAREARHRPDDLVEETDRLVEVLIERSLEDGFLTAMLTTDVAFVREETAIFYNQQSTSSEIEEVRIDGAQRLGMMGQPSWLVAFSEPDHNNPIRRGLFIQESLLCGHVPEIPIEDVPVLDFEGRTLREALGEHTSNGSCYTCHQTMDPLGLPFEQYDQYGRWRESEADAPVDTSGAIVWTGGEVSGGGPVAGPVELTERLAQSSHVSRCFLRHAFAFWMEREAELGDEPTLDAMLAAYEDTGGNFNASIEALLQSASFRRRMLPRR
ncbi:MAG: DUF1588 domain-containing protein [Myxococcota bacterium]